MATKSPDLTLVVGNTAEPPSVEAEIDRLFQLPLGEFTDARNALAKRAGKDGASIKSLQKPSVPAWAVNQLYWRDRSTYDKVIAAADALREEHRKHLSGKTADIRDAEKTHRDAVKAAADAVKQILADANEAASQATMAAVTETLEALPSEDQPGRLHRPLKPQGFEALAGLAALAALAPSKAKAAPSHGRPPKKDDSEAAKRQQEEARRAAEAAAREAEKELERERAAHEKEVRRAEAAIERAKEALEEANQLAAKRSEELQAAREALKKLRRFT